MASCQILCHALMTVKRREKKKKDLTDFFFLYTLQLTLQ